MVLREIENKNDTPINKYYKKARDLAYVITKWNMEKYDGKKFVVTSGAGPGIMEAANRGAHDAKGRLLVWEFHYHLNKQIING